MRRQPDPAPEPAAGESATLTRPSRAARSPGRPTAPTADPAHVSEAEGEPDELDEIGPSGVHRWIQGLGACTLSLVVHLVGLLVLAIWIVPGAGRAAVDTIVATVLERDELEFQELELEQQLEAATEMSVAVFSSSPLEGPVGSNGAGAPDAVQLDSKVLEQSSSLPSEIAVDAPTLSLPPSRKLIAAVPDGALGDPRAIVDDYAQALDRITQEIMWMLSKSDVLVIWSFDQSESMKDDQDEIRLRVDKVYQELGLTDAASGEHLMTAVTSYGAKFLVHTPKPTSDRLEIRAAIESVPVDPSGREMMCQAVSRAVAEYRDYAQRSRRQMALVLVTDESGEQENNARYLEAAIAEAKAARCRIYVLGREAVFGYPYAHMRWKHPQTGRTHWLRVDRGPETGFVEQLQTNGFRRRHEAFGSGFGPYEQTRMTRETGGIFFMLPSVEATIVRGEKRRYELEQMRAYKPDLRARIEVFADRDNYPLRTFLWKVVHDLDPYNRESAKTIEMRIEFSLDPAAFRRQALEEQQKAARFGTYLAEAQRVLEQARRYREQEADPRWQANYDLIDAQLIAYRARLIEYTAALEAFLRQPKTAPLTRSPNLRLVHWEIRTRKQTRTGELSGELIERARSLLDAVVQDHPGTPWAERAKWELQRGFGVDLVPDYEPPYPKVSNPIPVPQL